MTSPRRLVAIVVGAIAVAAGVAVAIVQLHQGKPNSVLSSVGCADTPYRGTAAGSVVYMDTSDTVFLTTHGTYGAKVANPAAPKRIRMPGAAAFNLRTPRYEGEQRVSLFNVAAAPTSSAIAAWYAIDHRMRLVIVQDGSIRRTIFTSSRNVVPSGPAWSNDGRHLFFSLFNGVFEQAHRHRYHYWLYVATLGRNGAVSNVARVPGGAGLTDPTVSPDGHRVAAISIRYLGYGSNRAINHLVIVDWKTGQRQVLLNGTSADQRIILRQPAWSPDGASIAVVRPRQSGGGNDILLVHASRRTTPPESAQVAVSGQGGYVRGRPQWLTSDELWFSSAAEGDDLDAPTPPNDLCSIHRTPGGGFTNPVDVTRTKARSETWATFTR